MTDPAELDDEIKARVAARIRERAQRRARLKRVRAEFDRRRQHGKAIAQRQKLQRLREDHAMTATAPEPTRCRFRGCPYLTRRRDGLCPAHAADVAAGVADPDETARPDDDG